jgi:hypothetical protein
MMMIGKLLSFAGSVTLISAFSSTVTMTMTTSAAADHCYQVNNGVIYCYDTLPPGRIHETWYSPEPPPLDRGHEWQCNLMAHPRTVCVSYDISGEPPEIPKYLADDPKSELVEHEE